MRKMQHNTLYTLTKCFGDSIWKIKEGRLKLKAVNLSVIVKSKVLTSFVLNMFLSWYTWNIFAAMPYEMGFPATHKKETLD